MDVFLYLGGLLLRAADFWVWGLLGLALLITAAGLIRLTRFPWRRIIRGSGPVVAILGTILILMSGYQVWYTHRPLPDNTQRMLFEGVTYIRDVRLEPRPLVIHVVTVALNTPDIGFLVTPGGPQLLARTTSEFLDEFDVQLAINGGFFQPFWTHSFWDYYPHSGDLVNMTGFASSIGTIYATGSPDHPTLVISEDNIASIVRPGNGAYNAISGNSTLVENGIRPAFPDNPFYTTLHPRTALGLDEQGQTLILFVVDGRQPGYSEGISLPELADIAIEYGAYQALNLDGGGSTALVIEGEDGQPAILNSPIDQYIPGHERPVANHLGVYATRTE
jgi:hypothetical protein